MQGKVYALIRGVVIISLCLSFAQNVYFYFKYDEALNNLLICTTSQCGKVEASVKDILKEVPNKSGLLQEVNLSLYNDLSKKAEQVGIDKEKLEKDIKDSGFSAEVKVKDIK